MAVQQTIRSAQRAPVVRVAYRPAIVVASLLVLVACGGAEPGPTPPAADTTPPTIQATSPAASASAVAPPAAITVTFSEPIDAATVTTASFTVNAAGVPVAGSVSASGVMASFVPAAPLAAGTAYTANVSAAVKDAAGNPLATALAWSFTTAASVTLKTWSAPVLLETADGPASQPVVAATSEDLPSTATQATAVWVQHDGTQPSIYANRFRDGVWQGAELVENDTVIGNISAGGVSSPRVAMGAFGRAVITWIHDDGNAGYSIWGAVHDEIFPAVDARQLSFGSNASDPQLSFDGTGHEVFNVWTQYDAGRPPASYRITQRQFLFVPCESFLPCAWDPLNVGWRSTTLIETDPNDAIAPQVSGFGSGGAVVVWGKAQGLFGLELWANTHSTAGGWASPVRVNPGSANRAEQHAVAAASDGSAITVWIESVAGRRTVFASRLSGTTWSTPQSFDDASAGQADAPQVVVDAAGNSLIVWVQFGGGAWDLYARRCPPGALPACSAPQKIGNLPGNAAAPRIAAAPNGDAIVVWQQTDASGQRSIYASNYTAAAASWSASPALIDAGAGGAQVAIDKRGIGTVVWSKFDAAGKSNIYASRFR